MTQRYAVDGVECETLDLQEVEDDPSCRCCCCTGECASQGYELEDALSLGMVEGDYA